MLNLKSVAYFVKHKIEKYIVWVLVLTFRYLKIAKNAPMSSSNYDS